MKTCTGCGLPKEDSEFGKHGKRLRSKCKPCHASDVKAYRSSNQEAVSARRKENYDSAKAVAHVAEWRIKNRDKYRAAARRSNKNRSEQRRIHNKARKLGLRVINELTPGQWEYAIPTYGGMCLFPGCSDRKVTMDHVTPVSKGGRHHISNLQPLCSHHNDVKGVKNTDYRAFVIMG